MQAHQNPIAVIVGAMVGHTICTGSALRTSQVHFLGLSFDVFEAPGMSFECIRKTRNNGLRISVLNAERWDANITVPQTAEM